MLLLLVVVVVVIAAPHLLLESSIFSASVLHICFSVNKLCAHSYYSQVRRVFADYYSCTDVREATKSLGVFLKEATAALELDSSSSRSGSVFPARLASRLKARLLQTADRLNYHLDGDKPMVLYRLWNRLVLHSGWLGRRGRARLLTAKRPRKTKPGSHAACSVFCLV